MEDHKPWCARPGNRLGPAGLSVAPVTHACAGLEDRSTNEEIQVSVTSWTETCAQSLGLVNAYLNHPPSPPQGSGGFVTIGSWTCSSNSGYDYVTTGVAGDCTGPEGTLAMTRS
jgi:hypothetical protein